MTNAQIATQTPPIVSPQEWEAARLRLLVKEKELIHARDALAAERRRMPWLAVEKAYEFEGPGGKASLLDPRRPPERPRHHAGVRLAGAAGGHRAPEGADGLGDAVVHPDRRLRQGLRGGRVAWHQRVHPLR